VPSAKTAQAWSAPTVTDNAFDKPETVTGVALKVAVELKPSPPEELLPQHFTIPVERTAQLLWLPVDTETAFEMPITFTGVRRELTVPSPSCPKPFSPQHLTVPSAKTAHE
jgi:hypothetical protein